MPTSDVVRKLPDVYRKDPGSNNYKLLQLGAEAVEELRECVARMEESQDIRTAVGQTLDLHGEKVGQPRGNAEDARYRVLLYNKMARDRGTGTQPDISAALRNILECGPQDFTLYDREDRPRRVRLRVENEEILENAPIGKTELKAILGQLLPVGVSYSLAIPYDTEFEISQGFSPVRLRIHERLNCWQVSPVLLDGRHRLDGSWTLDQRVVDHFFLRSLRIFGSFLIPADTGHIFRVSGGACEKVEAGETLWAFYGSARAPVKAEKPRWEIRSACSEMPAFSVSLTVRNTLWNLDGTVRLDGARRLNAGQVKKEEF